MVLTGKRLWQACPNLRILSELPVLSILPVLLPILAVLLPILPILRPILPILQHVLLLVLGLQGVGSTLLGEGDNQSRIVLIAREKRT